MRVDNEGRELTSVNDYVGRRNWPGTCRIDEGQIMPDWTVAVKVGDRVRSIESGRIGIVREITGSETGRTLSLTVQYGDEYDWNSTGAQYYRKVAD